MTHERANKCFTGGRIDDSAGNSPPPINHNVAYISGGIRLDEPTSCVCFWIVLGRYHERPTPWFHRAKFKSAIRISDINAYAAGEHPDYPEGAPDLALPPQRMWKGRYDEGSGRFALSPHDDGNGAPSITDEREAVAALSEHGVSGVMDDYKYWASHDNDPACGKPLWLTLGDASTYQLFFDDNIQCAAAAPPIP